MTFENILCVILFEVFYLLKVGSLSQCGKNYTIGNLWILGVLNFNFLENILNIACQEHQFLFILQEYILVMMVNTS